MLRLLAQLYGRNPVRVEWANSLIMDLAKHGVKISVSTARAYVYGMRKPSKVVLGALEKVKIDLLGDSDPEIPQHVMVEVDALNTRRLIRTITLDKRHRAMDDRYQQIAALARDAGAKIENYSNCVSAMCTMCVGPEAVCMISNCPLRSVSPMPLGYGAKTMEETERKSKDV